MPGATPLSELLSDPATRSEWLGPEHARARLQCRACVACVPAGGRYVRVASRVRVRVCVSVCVRSGGWPVSLSSLW